MDEQLTHEITAKRPYQVDVPVFINFFNRPELLQCVFDAVREARPSKLLLSCDGPRDGREDDIENIRRCREIVSRIDWDCEVYQNYSETNLRCGMRMYSGISWALEIVDRVIILEDDCVPTQEFFPFCAELLERYKDDNRIFMINAMNQLGVYEETPNSYFFGGGNCCGWATWRRAWKNVDFAMDFLDDEYSMRCVERKYPYYGNALEEGREKRKLIQENKKLSSWTYQAGMASALSAQMAIIPKVNMMTNIGFVGESEHCPNNIKKLPRKLQRLFFTPTYKMEFPLVHPRFVVEDWHYHDLLKKKFTCTIFDTLEGYARRVIYADKGELKQLIKKIPSKLRRR